MTQQVKMFSTEDLIAALREAVKTHPDRFVFVMSAHDEPNPDDRYVGGVNRVDATDYDDNGNRCPVPPCLDLDEDWGMTTSELLEALESAPTVPGKERTEYPTSVYLQGDSTVGIFDVDGTIVGTTMGDEGIELLVEP